MPDNIFGANDFTVDELEELFRDDDNQQETPPAQNDDNNPQTVVDDGSANTGNANTDVNTTKAFSRRLKESTEKARKEEREAIAKSLGYESYDDMQKKREKDLLDSKGLNSDDVSPVIDEIVKQRLNSDPRMEELETLRNSRMLEFGKRELAEITKLTGGEITTLSQLPQEVLNLWKEKGSLKKAYLEVEGEKLINRMRSKESKGSTSHLTNPTGTIPSQPKQRHLTDEEKQMWRLFHPHITDEELNKKMVNI